MNILVDDLDKAVPFYRDLVGLELDETPDHDFPSQFFKFANGTQIHMNQFEDALYGEHLKDTNMEYTDYIDKDSFIDYIIMSELFKNIDI